jgi:predicted transcriptional regulator
MKTIEINHEELTKDIQVIITKSAKETKAKVFECENDFVLIVFEAEEKAKGDVHNKIDDDTIQEIYKRLNENHSIKDIAQQLNISTKTVYNYRNQKTELKAKAI